MVTLQFTFEELYKKVSEFLGLGTSPSGTNLTLCKDIVYAGYRRFLVAHTWTFLKRYDKLYTTADKFDYELPADFSEMVGSFVFDDSDGHPPIEQRSESEIMDMRAANDMSGYPSYCTIRPGHYTKETGQRYEVIFYPEPNGIYVLHYSCLIMPEKLSATTDVPIGGADMSECIKTLCIAEAESSQDDTAGVQEGKGQRLLAEAIKKDNRRKPATLGYNANGYGMSAFEIARGTTRINSVNYNT